MTIVEIVQALVRPVITVMLTGTFCILAYKSNIVITSDSLNSIVLAAIAFWFGQRTAEKSNVIPQVSVGDRGSATVNNNSSPAA